MQTHKTKSLVLLILMVLILIVMAPTIGAGEEERFLGNVMRVSGLERGMERMTVSGPQLPFAGP